MFQWSTSANSSEAGHTSGTRTIVWRYCILLLLSWPIVNPLVFFFHSINGAILATAVPKRRRPARSIFDGFRDFQTETSTSSRKSVLAFSTVTFLCFTTVSVLVVVRQEQELRNGTVDKKLSTLADLFRPPIELMHKGSFETVRSLSRGILHSQFWFSLCEPSDDFSKQVKS